MLRVLREQRTDESEVKDDDRWLRIKEVERRIEAWTSKHGGTVDEAYDALQIDPLTLEDL